MLWLATSSRVGFFGSGSARATCTTEPSSPSTISSSTSFLGAATGAASKCDSLGSSHSSSSSLGRPPPRLAEGLTGHKRLVSLTQGLAKTDVLGSVISMSSPIRAISLNKGQLLSCQPVRDTSACLDKYDVITKFDHSSHAQDRDINL